MGTYTLVKPKTGCPPGWMEGWRRQDSEDKNNKNWIAYDHHFYGKILKLYTFKKYLLNYYKMLIIKSILSLLDVLNYISSDEQTCKFN